MNRGRIFWTVILAVGIALSAQHAVAQSATSVTGAGAAVLPGGALYQTVSLTDLKFGMGVLLAGGGASGDFESTLMGTSTAGVPQTISVVGKPSAGSGSVSGANLSGLCSVDMGDGTPAASGVPFALTVSPGADGKWTMLMVLGSTSLPTATLTSGSITVK